MSQGAIITKRLVIRSFIPEDLRTVHRILDQTMGDGRRVQDQAALQERLSWLEWSILNQEWFHRMHQFPYGDRAIALKSTRAVIGVTGYVPLRDVYDQIPELRQAAGPDTYATPEVGLFWAVDPQYQRQGFASEAAAALIEYAFNQLRLKRILATTEYRNAASQAVMRKVGMQITRNPLPEPAWLQVVGVLQNPF